MPRDVAAGVAQVGVPARAGIAAVLKVGRVEAQPSDDGEGVTGRA